jgi:hypothetical protein
MISAKTGGWKVGGIPVEASAGDIKGFMSDYSRKDDRRAQTSIGSGPLGSNTTCLSVPGLPSSSRLARVPSPESSRAYYLVGILRLPCQVAVFRRAAPRRVPSWPVP